MTHRSPAPRQDTLTSSDLERQLKAIHADALRWAISCARGDADEGADLLQEAYIRLLDGRATFEGRSTLKTWLFGVIRGLAINHQRGLRRQLRLLAHRATALARSLHSDRPEEGSTSLSLLVGAEARAEEGAALDAALSALSARQREVIELVFVHELTVEEAAGIMDVAVGSARTHYARAKERLAQRLGAPQELLVTHAQEGYADV